MLVAVLCLEWHFDVVFAVTACRYVTSVSYRRRESFQLFMRCSVVLVPSRLHVGGSSLFSVKEELTTSPRSPRAPDFIEIRNDTCSSYRRLLRTWHHVEQHHWHTTVVLLKV